MAYDTPPDIWRRMGEYVHQDFITQFPNILDGIFEFFSDQDQIEILKLNSYFNENIDKIFNSSMARKFWIQSGAEFLLASEKNAQNLIRDISKIVFKMTHGA